MVETLIHNIEAVTPRGVSHAFLTIDSWGKIVRVEFGDPTEGDIAGAAKVINGRGALLMPGCIDCHVHFREPGLTHKASIATESRAAVAGGVTSFIDMPNTLPQTVSMADVDDKLAIAAATSVANYGFFIGATNDNIDEVLNADYGRVAGVKLFMGSSTGNMLVDSENTLERLFAKAQALIAVHAEDEAVIARCREQIKAQYGEDAPVALHTELRPAEACVKASKRAVELARRYGTRLHIAHVTTAAELELLDGSGDIETRKVTGEVSPHHLWWTADDYADRGSRIKMNPSVKTNDDRRALRQAVADGVISVVATDHAPHLLSEKAGSLFKAASGAPMVQFSLVTMLEMFAPETVASVMADNPARLLRIAKRGRLAPDYYADLVLVERDTAGHTITDSEVVSRCGWTPMDGVTVHHRVVATWVNGQMVFNNGCFADGVRGMQLEYNR